MSDTPRTDKETWEDVGFDALVTAHFARELERELATLRSDLAMAQAERDEARRNYCVLWAIDQLHDANPNALISYGESRRIAREIAVERGWNCFDAHTNATDVPVRNGGEP